MVRELYTEGVRWQAQTKKVVGRSTSQPKSNKGVTKISTNDGNRRQERSEGERVGMGAEERPSG